MLLPGGLLLGLELELAMVLDVEVDGEINPEGAEDRTPISISISMPNVDSDSSHGWEKLGKGSPRDVIKGRDASAVSWISSAGGVILPPIGKVTATGGGGSLATNSAVDGFAGEFSSSTADASSASIANPKNGAHVLLTHSVHRYSANRLR